MSIRPCCNVCDSGTNLSRCASCKLTLYCCREHQQVDWIAHKRACKHVQKSRTSLIREEQTLRDHPGDFMTPANPFDTAVGQFWGILDTRDYMRARYKLVEDILKLNTFNAVDAAADHLIDMLRLCRGDNMGVRQQLPFLLMRLNRDQHCYDFVKWWVTRGSIGDYDFGDVTLPYLDIVGADVFEPVDYLCKEFAASVSHLISTTLLKIKLLLDLKDLRASQALLIRNIPQEVVFQVQHYLPRSNLIDDSIITSGYAQSIQSLSLQVDRLYRVVHRENSYFWPALVKPEKHLNARPVAYSRGSIEEMQLVLNYSFNSWMETPGAIEFIKMKLKR